MPRQKTALINITDPNGMAAHMLRYLEWMAIKNYSERTTNARRVDLHNFNTWCEERSLHRAQDITKPILERYQRHLFYYRKENGKPLSFGRQGVLMISLKGFFKWLARNNYILYNPASEIDLPKREHRLPKAILTAEEAESILNQPDITEALGIRDRAILETFYSTGIRRAELAALTVYSIDRDRGTVFVEQGKGKKDRVVPIGERAQRWVEKYLNEVRSQYSVDPSETTLFLNYKGRGIVPDSLSFMVRDYIEQAKINKTGSCHLFRHTMATVMLENGADIRFIQEMLGHARLDTTQEYTRVSITKLKEIHNATHPTAVLKRRKQSKDTVTNAVTDTPKPTDTVH
ncbi:Site-specific tyrosine recombinase RSp0090 [hydrothermal vent metagenome]|uniref:Site-specific tyrosine recombinase RSp0090 n=1 Tax=hydrothermal vent metagenome TaxID=652676 RepID=A0A3B0YAE1_9ZZZZ